MRRLFKSFSLALFMAAFFLGGCAVESTLRRESSQGGTYECAQSGSGFGMISATAAHKRCLKSLGKF